MIVNETVRSLLIDLYFDEAAGEPELEPHRDAITAALEVQKHPFISASINEVHPGDIVHWDAVPDVFDLDVSATLTGGIGGNLNKALDALQDEREGDFKKALADILDAATRLARFAGAM